jgi:outer membrane protein assembly factor BamB
MPRSILPLALAGLLMNADSLHAEDWPEFRGPTGQGISHAHKLPTEWSATKNVAWKRELPGLGWSSPVVVAGKVYLTTATNIAGNKDWSLRALCLDAKDGQILWNKEVYRPASAKSPKIHSKNSHASPTPIVHGERLYVHFGHEVTACLDLTGNVLWRYRDPYPPVHGAGGSPVLVDGLLVFSADGASKRLVVALKADTGKLAWKTTRPEKPVKNFSFSTPLVITVNGKKQIVSPSSDVVCAYDPATGQEIWHARYKGYSVIPRPVCGHGLVFVVTGYDAPGMIAVRPDGTGDVTDSHVKWSATKGAPHTPSLLLVGDELFMVSDGGVASCLDAVTGKIHWSKRLPGKGYSASPIAAGGKVYFLSEDGVGTVVKAATAFEQISKNELGEQTLASYAVGDGALFIRSAKHLYRIGK